MFKVARFFLKKSSYDCIIFASFVKVICIAGKNFEPLKVVALGCTDSMPMYFLSNILSHFR